MDNTRQDFPKLVEQQSYCDGNINSQSSLSLQIKANEALRHTCQHGLSLESCSVADINNILNVINYSAVLTALNIYGLQMSVMTVDDSVMTRNIGAYTNRWIWDQGFEIQWP